MRRAGLVLVAVALSFLTVPAWANHSVPTGVNCSNFAYQEDAQAYLEQHPGDPEGLDGPPGPTSSGIPGVACENLPTRGTATTTTTATIPPTTTTVPTLPQGPSPAPDLVEPPRAILSAASGQVAGDRGDYCWPQPSGLTTCLHVDFFVGGPNPAQALTVTRGEVATLSFEAAPALAALRIGVLSSEPNAPTLPAPVANPSRFTVDLPPGTHVIAVNATFEGANARATYFFKLQVVQATAPPAEPSTGRLLALTG